MTASRPVFRILCESPNPAADAALLAALEKADSPTQQAIIETVLARKQRPGLYGLVARLHLLDDPLRQSLAAEIDTLFGVLREAAQSRVEQTHLNTLEMIRRGRAYRASYLLDGALRDTSSRVREAAGQTLYELAEAILTSGPAPPDPVALAAMSPDEVRTRMAAVESHAEDRRQLVSAVETALGLYEVHRQNRVVEAAIWFADDLGPQFWAVMSTPGSRVAHVALRLFGEGLTPRLVPFAMAALNYHQFRTHVAHILSHCNDPATLTEWLLQSWRLIQPKAARAMTAIKELACLERRGASLMRLPPQAQRFLGRWVMATGMPTECKADALLQIFQRGDPAGRRSTVWAATGWTEDAATQFLRNLATDAVPEFARMAVCELARRRPLEFPVADLLRSRPAVAAKEPLPTESGKMTFERYWANFDYLTDAQKVEDGQELLRLAPQVPIHLSRYLAEPDPAARVRALSIIRILGLGEAFAEQLYPLGHDLDPEVRSAVMSALAQVPGGTARRILHSALSDQVPRVRANAVEAVEQIGADDIARLLLPMLGAPDNRVRANAVRALLRQGVRPAAETLLKMLDDPDRAQRISGLWLVERMSLLVMAAKIMRMAACDEDPQVRMRAQQIIGQLRRQMAKEGAGPDLKAEAVQEVLAP